MKIHRFFLEQPLGEELIVKEKSLIHQWNNVLKFKTKERIKLFNSSCLGFDFIYEIQNITKNQVNLDFIEKVENLLQKDSLNSVNLCVSLIKKEKIDLILEKCSEIGVINFTPIISERTEKKNISSFNIERSEKIIKEAIEQSGWGYIPKISNSVDLKSFIKDNKNTFVLDISENNIKDLVYLNKDNKEINILIGPEGGFTESERELFLKNNIKTISFGENVLRSETAAILSSFLFVN